MTHTTRESLVMVSRRCSEVAEQLEARVNLARNAREAGAGALWLWHVAQLGDLVIRHWRTILGALKRTEFEAANRVAEFDRYAAGGAPAAPPARPSAVTPN